MKIQPGCGLWLDNRQLLIERANWPEPVSVLQILQYLQVKGRDGSRLS